MEFLVLRFYYRMVSESTKIVVCQNSCKNNILTSYVTKIYKYKQELSTNVDTKRRHLKKFTFEPIKLIKIAHHKSCIEAKSIFHLSTRRSNQIFSCTGEANKLTNRKNACFQASTVRMKISIFEASFFY